MGNSSNRAIIRDKLGNRVFDIINIDGVEIIDVKEGKSHKYVEYDDFLKQREQQQETVN